MLCIIFFSGPLISINSVSVRPSVRLSVRFSVYLFACSFICPFGIICPDVIVPLSNAPYLDIQRGGGAEEMDEEKEEGRTRRRWRTGRKKTTRRKRMTIGGGYLGYMFNCTQLFTVFHEF